MALTTRIIEPNVIRIENSTATQIKVEKKIGYKDKDGNIIIEPIFDDGQFSTSISRGNNLSVLKNEKCGVIDICGKTIVPFEYDEVYRISDGLFFVRRNTDEDNWVIGVVGADATIIVPLQYKFIEYKDGFFRCYKKAYSKRSYMNTDGRIYEYSSLGDSVWLNRFGLPIYTGEVVSNTNNYLIVKENDKLGAINSNGEYTIQCIYDELNTTSIDRFVAGFKDDWSRHCGIIDNNGNIVVDFKFYQISYDSSSFYQCYKDKNQHPLWLNRDGDIIHEGDAQILSDELLAIKSNGKWGVITQSGTRVVNFIYDCVGIIKDKIIVSKDAKLGILNSDGSVAINPSYISIECAAIDDDTILCRNFYHHPADYVLYGQYNKECVFDTESNPPIYCASIQYGNVVYDEQIIFVHHIYKFDFDKLFILKGENYCELFSLKNGIIANSRFDSILKLTNTYFAVKQNNLWGVFDAVSGDYILSCEYKRLVYEGKNYIYLNKDDLWGAKSILSQGDCETTDSSNYVDVPIQYNEITQLNYAHETIFGVKWNNGRGWNGYTIVNSFGQFYNKELTIHYRFDKQCEVFDNNLDRILGTIDGKMGFVSVKGYDAITFQYDEVQRRCDGLFDVRIGRAWGVLDMVSGREIVNIKYSEQIPIEFENTIVRNASTYRYGILSKDGTEKIPSIYEHLKVEDDVIFFGYGGFESETISNFFGGEINSAIWGVIDKTGKEVIHAYYDCYKDAGRFLLAGRDGHMIGSDDSRCDDIYYSDYNGKYDLFTKSGEFIIGGFSEFHYDKDNEVYMFFIGGKWERQTKEVDGWGNYEEYYTYERDNGAWLFLDKNLNSIIKDSKGGQIQFYKGFRFDKEDVLHDANGALLQGIPNEILTKGFHGIQGCNLIIGNDFSYADSEGVYYNRYAALNMITGKQTPYYEKLESIGKSKHLFLLEHGDYMRVEEHEEVALHKDFFYFLEGNKVGVCNYKSTILPAEYLFISNPVDGFYLAAKEIDEEYSCLTLFSFNDCSFKLSIIPKILTSELIKATKYTSLEVEAKNVDKTILSEYAILAQTYVEDASSNNPYWSFAKINYFTDDYRLRKDTYCSMDYYDDYDRPDYAGDTWDAMTDGMYGDMPDGFDGDYSFLGR